MRGTTRYILRQIAGPLFFVTITLTGILWLAQSLRFIDRIVNSGLPFTSFVYFTTLLLPGLLSIILPIALFCAVLYAYYRLASDSELVVLWAAGVSKSALARPALIVATLVAIVVYVLLLYLMPLGARTFRTVQYEFRTNLASVLIQEGVFNTPMHGLTVYVRERRQDGEMLGILVHDNRDPQRAVTMMAERGALINTPLGPRMVLANGNRQQIEQGNNQLSLLYFDSYAIDLNMYARADGEGWREPRERFLNELFYPDMSSPDDRKNYWALISEGHRRLAGPLSCYSLALIALATILAGEFNRRGQTRRILAALAAAIALQVCGLGFQYLANKTPAMIVLLYLNPVVFAGGAAYILLRTRRRRVLSPAPAGA